jgi:hypothetical protein
MISNIEIKNNAPDFCIKVNFCWLEIGCSVEIFTKKMRPAKFTKTFTKKMRPAKFTKTFTKKNASGKIYKNIYKKKCVRQNLQKHLQKKCVRQNLQKHLQKMRPAKFTKTFTKNASGKIYKNIYKK